MEDRAIQVRQPATLNATAACAGWFDVTFVRDECGRRGWNVWALCERPQNVVLLQARPRPTCRAPLRAQMSVFTCRSGAQVVERTAVEVHLSLR